MQRQELADRAEEAAIARFLAIREAFWPCWGAKAEAWVAIKRHRRRAADH
jgi:transposase